jgi:hypothetical protein
MQAVQSTIGADAATFDQQLSAAAGELGEADTITKSKIMLSSF